MSWPALPVVYGQARPAVRTPARMLAAAVEATPLWTASKARPAAGQYPTRAWPELNRAVAAGSAQLGCVPLNLVTSVGARALSTRPKATAHACCSESEYSTAQLLGWRPPSSCTAQS